MTSVVECTPISVESRDLIAGEMFDVEGSEPPRYASVLPYAVSTRSDSSGKNVVFPLKHASGSSKSATERRPGPQDTYRVVRVPVVQPRAAEDENVSRRHSFYVVAVPEEAIATTTPPPADGRRRSDTTGTPRSSKRRSRRLVRKSGAYNVTGVGITKRQRMYISDLFTTLVEMRWLSQFAFIAVQFLISWLLFGTVYYVIAFSRGDLDLAAGDNVTRTACIDRMTGYASAVMFSMESQTTIGYGDQVPDPACQIGIVVVMTQSIVGTFIQVIVAGIIFAKISGPDGRAKTLMFSRNAVICVRDGQYQLMFRVGDMRNKSHIIGTSIRALMVRNRLTAEGELIPMCQYPLSLDNDTSSVDDDYLFMAWPVTVVHKIDKSSPLWDVSAEQLIAEQFEIVVILEGTVESTGSSAQVRASYLPSEILWGQRLAPLVAYHKENNSYTIDYGQFHHSLPVSMPDVSAKQCSASGATIPTVADDYQSNFTTGVNAPVGQVRRFINLIFRRLPAVNVVGTAQR